MNEEGKYHHRSEVEKAQRIATLIMSFIKGDIGAKDHDELDAWINESDENMRLFEELTDEQYLNETADWAKGVDTGAALEKVRERIGLGKVRRKPRAFQWIAAAVATIAIGIAVVWKMLPTKIEEPEKPILSAGEIFPSGKKATLRLADNSVVVLDSMADGAMKTSNGEIEKKGDALIYGNAQAGKMGMNTLSTPLGGQYQLKLPDGTWVWLNAATKLQYPTAFVGNTRDVKLEGEAYFEVAENRDKPFRVCMGVDTVQVLGTYFNCEAYQEDGNNAITLIAGSIALKSMGNETLLKPGQTAVSNKAGNIKLRNDADTASILGWKRGLFVFHDQPIGELMREAARWYDVKLRFKDNINYHFNATIERKESLGKLLQLLEGTGHVHFEMEGRVVVVRE